MGAYSLNRNNFNVTRPGRFDKTDFCFITTKKEMRKLIECCKKTGYASIDFETSGNKLYNKDFYPTIFGISWEAGKAAVLPMGHFESPIPETRWRRLFRLFAREILLNPDVVKVAWNMKFEHQIVKLLGYDMVGRLFDGMIAKYLLDEERPNGLKDMVRRFMPQYGDYEDDYEGSKLPWDKKPLLGLSQYCAMDCDLTLRLTLFFERKLIKGGFYNLYRNLLMMASRVIVDMEREGQGFDKPFNDTLVVKYAKLLKENEETLRGFKRVKKFNKYFIQGKIEKYLESIRNEIKELQEEYRKSPDEKTKNQKARGIRSREEKIARIQAGEFTTKKELELTQPLNFASSNQMVELLFTSEYGFRYPIIAYTKKDKKETDRPSTAEDVLIELRERHDKSGFAAALLEFRGLEKINSAFILGLKEHLQDDGRIHPKFNLTQTTTGRLSSSEPNAQQYPRVATNPDVRKMLIPRPGKLYLMMDYSQAELRILAALAGEETMLQWFREGRDIHLASACKKYNEDYNKILPIYNNENHKDYKIWEVRRKQAKTINFGIVYEQSAMKLASSLSTPEEPVSIQDAQKFLDEFFELFPKVRDFIETQHELAKEDGYVISLWGRKRRLPDVFGDNYQKYLEALRQSTNTPCQGAASDFCLFTQVLIWEMKSKGIKFKEITQVGTVHDSIYFEVAPEDINPKLIYDLWSLAKNPDTEKWFGFKVDTVEMSMDFEIGRSQGEELPFAPLYNYKKLVDGKMEKDDYFNNYANKYKNIPISEYPNKFPKYFKDTQLC